jgi:hypothetical protein
MRLQGGFELLSASCLSLEILVEGQQLVWKHGHVLTLKKAGKFRENASTNFLISNKHCSSQKAKKKSHI